LINSFESLRKKQKVLERIYTLDADKQKHILETYYGGKLEVK
jgi:hypothetical protein